MVLPPRGSVEANKIMHMNNSVRCLTHAGVSNTLPAAAAAAAFLGVCLGGAGCLCLGLRDAWNSEETRQAGQTKCRGKTGLRGVCPGQTPHEDFILKEECGQETMEEGKAGGSGLRDDVLHGPRT